MEWSGSKQGVRSRGRAAARLDGLSPLHSLEARVDDHEAIGRLKAGDLSGLEVLVRRYQTPAIETAYLITHDLPLAEDVVHDLYLQLDRSIRTFDLTYPFKPWFMRCVVNASLRAARAARRDVGFETPVAAGAEGDLTLGDLLPDPAVGPDDLLEQNELEAAVEAALWRLAPEQRAAVVLRYYLELGDDEISEQLNCATSTVRWRLHAARRQLRAWLWRLSPDQTRTGW